MKAVGRFFGGTSANPREFKTQLFSKVDLN